MSAQRRAQVVLFITCGILAYIAVPITDYRGFFVTGKGVIASSSNERPVNWKLDNVRIVSAAINSLANPGETVVSFWPGYIFQSSTAPYSGLECDSGITASAEMSAAQRIAYHVASRRQIETDIDLRKPRIVVVGNQEYWHQPREPYVEALTRAGYRVDRKVGDTLIFVRRW